jgi:formimidoylglutamate deiminase
VGVAPAPAPARTAAAHGMAGEPGWLPDCVFTGGKFEFGVAFFADALGRITRFSREPKDLAIARRLEGQAALPGLVNAHSHTLHRVLRGRTDRPRPVAATPGGGGGRDPHGLLAEAAARLTPDDVFDVARIAFLEMLVSGVTCVGEFHYVHSGAEGAPAEPGLLARAVVRAARDVGIRIALLNTAWVRAGFGEAAGSGPAPFRSGAADRFVRETDLLRAWVAAHHPADEAWLGIAAHGLGAVPLEDFKAVAAYAHSQRMRLHAHVSVEAEENASCQGEYGRTPVALLAAHGLVDKRFTAIDAIHLTEEEVRVLGAARASVCVAPSSAATSGLGFGPVPGLLEAGAGVAFGSDRQVQIDLLKEARLLEYGLRGAGRQRAAFGTRPAAALLHGATVAGARCLGATGGALEVGRPADFFTVNLYDPSIAGADGESLLENLVFALERRAIREVWIGARQRVTGGRHPHQGAIIGRFVEAQKRLWGGAGVATSG